MPAVLDRFERWRRSILGKRSTRELKGAELTPKQLDSFTYKVLPPTDRDVWLTVVGADTTTTLEHVINSLSKQASVMFQRASDLMSEHKNLRLKESYRQLSGWARNRSAENVLWLITLEETLTQTLQHCVARFLEREDAVEFEDLRIAIDESFIRRDEHVAFWREWFRNSAMSRSRTEGLAIPREWRTYEHPFIRRFEIHPGLLNLNELFVRRTGFFRSDTLPGLQIADICANICYRHHRGDTALPAYHRLRPRIVGRDGRVLTTVHVDVSSLHLDDPRNHVTRFDLNAWKRYADERRSKSADTKD